MSNINKWSVREKIESIILVLSLIWFLSILNDELPEYLQHLEIRRQLQERGVALSGRSPTALFLGGLSIPFFLFVFCVLGIRKRIKQAIAAVSQSGIQIADRIGIGWTIVIIIVVISVIGSLLKRLDLI